MQVNIPIDISLLMQAIKVTLAYMLITGIAGGYVVSLVLGLRKPVTYPDNRRD